MKYEEMIAIIVLVSLYVLALPLVSFYVKKKESAQDSKRLILHYETLIYLLILLVTQIFLIVKFFPDGIETPIKISEIVKLLPMCIILAYGILNTIGDTFGFVEQISFGLTGLFAEYIGKNERRNISLKLIVKEIILSIFIFIAAAWIYGFIWIIKKFT